MNDYVVLLPPSEGKTPHGDSQNIYRKVRNFKESNYFLDLESDREYIYSKLIQSFSDLDEKQLEKLFGVKGKNLQNVVDTNYSLLESPTLKAIDRYSGVMFKAINYHEMSKKKRDLFDSKVLFISGMFGLLKPTDLIGDYKLKIDSKFFDINLQKFWKEKLEELFLKEFENKIVIDILPGAHRNVVDLSKSKENYSIIFYDLKDGKLKQAGHNSKVLKGEIVRYILDNDKIDRKYIEEFKHSEGYEYSDEYSGENLIAFLKSNF